MQIFIDESGSFVIPTPSKPSISCVSALVIPDVYYSAVCTSFQRIKDDWGIGTAEVKGSALDEHRVAEVIRMLSRFYVILETTAIDMGMQTEDAITRHKASQVEKLMENVTPLHHDSLIADIRGIQLRLRGTSNQLYIQASVMFHLIPKVVQKATIYYVQRHPTELSRFRWVIDAKSNSITAYEDLWRLLVMPTFQSQSFREPLIMLKGADYSHYERFQGTLDRPPEYLKEVLGEEGPFPYTKLNALLGEDLSFQKSEREIGLQLVDILCNASRRAMNGNLGISGWREMGPLYLQEPEDRQVLQLIDLSRTESRSLTGRDVPYAPFINLIQRSRKQMLL